MVNSLVNLSGLCILSICFLFSTIESEIFTAVNDMAFSLKTEELIIDYLNDFLVTQDSRLAHFQREYTRLTHLKNGMNATSTDDQMQMLKSVLIKKRLAKDWNYLSEIIAEDFSNKNECSAYINTLKHENKYYPTKKDLTGAALALIRLQRTYQLKPSDLANGTINNVQSRSKLSSSDCYQLGCEALKNKKYYLSTLWLEEALKLELASVHTSNRMKIKILNNLIVTYRQIEEHSSVIQAMKHILEINPNDTLTAFKLATLQKLATGKRPSVTYLTTERDRKIAEDMTVGTMTNVANAYKSYEFEKKLYEALCRGDVKPTPKELAPLRCRYITNTSAFLKIAPLKIEEVSLDPYVVIFHEVMYDSEIKVIIRKRKRKLKRAVVQGDEGETIVSSYRISKSAWLNDDSHKCVGDISRRVVDMTGLSLESAEELQVVNYGIGGYYDVHYDFALPGDLSFDAIDIGNRIATVLFYMSDVLEGGATAFPLIRRAVFPKKGTALVWWNLHTSGVGDLRTKHAGCPVLVGNKWVCNKWLHAAHQELLRPCKLHPDHKPGEEKEIEYL